MTTRRIVVPILLIATLSACGSSKPDQAQLSNVTTTTCATGPLVGPDSALSQEQIKQLGENGGGCYNAYSTVPKR